MKLACIGPQCVGKSTLIGALLSEPTFKGYQAFPERVRFLKSNYGYNLYTGNTDIQLSILALQVFDSAAENVILDRTVVDSLSYALYYHRRDDPRIPDHILQFITDLSKRIVERLDHIIFLHPSFEMIPDGVRVVDKNQQQEIDQVMYEVLQMLEVPNNKIIHIHGGSVRERVDWVLRSVV